MRANLAILDMHFGNNYSEPPCHAFALHFGEKWMSGVHECFLSCQGNGIFSDLVLRIGALNFVDDRM